MVKAVNTKKEQVNVKVEQNTPAVKVEEDRNNEQLVTKKKQPHKIIIRNLIVDVNQKHVKKLCSPFGEIKDVQIPMHPLKKCSRGFAFVEFETKIMCRKAIKGLNATSFKGRTIIVDMAVSKDKFLEFKQNIDKQAGDQDNNIKMQEEEEIVKTEDVSKKQTKSKKKQKIKTEEKQEIKVKEEKKEDQDLSCTIFIRNLASTTKQNQLFNFVKRFGKTKFVKLVIDKQTQECKGTAFVKFLESAPAQKLIKYSKDFEQAQVPGSRTNFKEDPEINLDINGRIIRIYPAESRTDLASKLETRNNKEEKKDLKPLKKIRKIEELIQHDKNDSRNLKLAIEGVCRVQSWMKSEDKQRFSNHEASKLQKLKNPNNIVSNTRIVLKFLPKTLGDQNIKQICHTFIREKYPGKHKSLTFCKLMLDAERKKSTGVAFVQFANHQISLNFLQWIKQMNKQLFDGDVVLSQFAIQDAKKLIKLNNRKRIQKPQQQQQRPQRNQRSSSKGGKSYKPSRQSKPKSFNKPKRT